MNSDFLKWAPRDFRWAPNWVPFFYQKTCQTCQMTNPHYLIKTCEVLISLWLKNKKDLTLL